jgi:hypothetical protein
MVDRFIDVLKIPLHIEVREVKEKLKRGKNAKTMRIGLIACLYKATRKIKPNRVDFYF